MPDARYTGLQIEHGAPRGRYRVVDKEQLAYATQEGALLLRVLTSSKVVVALSQDWHVIACAKCGTHMHRDGAVTTCQRCGLVGTIPPGATHVVETTEFLVLDSQDKIYDELRAQAARAEECRHAAETKLRADAELLKTAEALAKSRGQELEIARNSATDCIRALDRTRLEKAKLEGDLAKVRTAIGDIRWKEIVG